MISSRLISALVRMGLSNHDARVYAALVYFHSVGAKDLIDYVQISKPSVYESLQRLVDRGLADKKSAKPALYTPVSPRVAVDVLTHELHQAAETALEELGTLSEVRKNIEENDAIWTVYGEKSVEHKIREMLTSAQDRIVCFLGEKYLPLFAGLSLRARTTMYLISKNQEIINTAEEILKAADASVTLVPMEKMMEFGFHSKKTGEHLKYLNLGNSFELIIDEREILSIPPIEMDKITGLHSLSEVMVFIAQERMDMLIRHLNAEIVAEDQDEL
jgi:sugar-specific transcriptional regulator TrmB